MEQIKIYEETFKQLIATQISPVQLDSLVYTEDIPNENPAWHAENSTSLTCSYCRVEFSDSIQHREHYKLDWHRYNLKQSLLTKQPISEEQFTERTGDISSIEGSDSEKEETLDHIATAQGKIFLKNEDNKVFSLYKCLLAQRKTELTEVNISYELDRIHKNNQWTVLMLGGGHFAGAVFQGDTPTLHKTFHCYTVRAGQGGSQSSKDSKNASSAPKSAGASLRRYNENALNQHVKDILEVWKNEIAGSSLIIYRAAGPYNRNVLFGGKTPLLEKGDSRLRMVPFSTRRPTFTELKRVYSILSTIYAYDTLETATLQFSKHILPDESKRNKAKSSSINRAKSRETVQRPSPVDISSSSSESSDEETVTANKSKKQPEFEMVDLDISFQEALETFGDSLTPEQKKQKRKKNPKKSKSAKLRDSEAARKSELCNVVEGGQLDKLKNIFKTYEVPHEMIADQTNEVKIDHTNEIVDDMGHTLLHLAAIHGKADILLFLLENGANVCAKNGKQHTPYTCTQNKEIREAFKEYARTNPDKYNYNKAQIPLPVPSTLTADEIAEKKKLQRKVKRDKEKEKRKEKAVESKEQAEQQRFLTLSDREKRALAAERRILNQAGVVITRCFLCASDIAGKVPFEYLANRFCSIECLKAHRRKTPVVLS